MIVTTIIHEYSSHCISINLSSGRSLIQLLPPIHTLNLLENLTIRPLQLPLPILDSLVPAPLVVNKRAILLLGRVQLGELIALKVRRHIEGRSSFLAADDKGAAHDRVVALAVDGGSSKYVFTGGFEASEEST